MINTKFGPKKILLIGGLDPTGHAGLLRDIQTCQDLKQNYFAFPTALTAQNDQRYIGTAEPTMDYLKGLWSCLDPKSIYAVKIGMLTSSAILHFIVQNLIVLKNSRKKLKIVWDPVFLSTSGGTLLNKSGIKRAKRELLPLVDIITPNAQEACEMINIPYSKNTDPEMICVNFYSLYKKPIYLKGGHLKHKATDYFYDGKVLKKLSAKATSKKIRGTGCMHSTAITCYLTKGDPLLKACQKSKKYMTKLFQE